MSKNKDGPDYRDSKIFMNEGELREGHMIDVAGMDPSQQYMGEGSGAIPSPFAGGGEGLDSANASVPVDSI